MSPHYLTVNVLGKVFQVDGDQEKASVTILVSDQTNCVQN